MQNGEEIVIYQTQDGLTKFDVRLEDETVWITQDQMTELFMRDKSTISRHIKNIFADGELDEKSVVAFFATTATNHTGFSRQLFNNRQQNNLSDWGIVEGCRKASLRFHANERYTNRDYQI